MHVTYNYLRDVTELCAVVCCGCYLLVCLCLDDMAVSKPMHVICVCMVLNNMLWFRIICT